MSNAAKDGAIFGAMDIAGVDFVPHRVARINSNARSPFFRSLALSSKDVG